MQATSRHLAPGVWSEHVSLLSTSQLAVPACSQTHSELYTCCPQQACIRLLLECPSPVRAQHPGPPDALTQSCRPSICIQLTVLNYTGPDRCLVGRPWTLHLEGDTFLRDSVGFACATDSLLPPLGHSPSASPSLGEAGSSIPVAGKRPVFVCITPLSEQKSWINENKVPV